jgi:hypothetical protein
MAENIKEKAEQAGQRIAAKASEIGHEVSEKMEEAKDWVKEKAYQASHPSAAPLSESTGPVGSPADIREHMNVYASCGTFVGTVDRVEGNRIKLTRKDSPDGQHHLIPVSWVAKVHDHVHLSKDHKEVQSQWQPA